VWAFGIGLVAVALSLAADVGRELTPPTRVLVQARNRVVAHPAVPAALRESGRVKDFFAWAAPRVEAGLARLPDADVLAQAVRMAQVLERATPAECAAIARVDSRGDAMGDVLEHLAAADPTFAQAWMALRMRALRAELDGAPPAHHAVRAQQLGAVAAALPAALPPPARARFAGLSGRLAQAGDADACWRARTAIATVLALPREPRVVWARVLLGQPVQPR
jgi:hypothetical protein